MTRKLLWRCIGGVTTLLLVGGNAACTDNDDNKPKGSPRATAVDASGGTFPINGVNVTVPADAIRSKTELNVSVPLRTLAANAPFGLGNSTRVDISFKDGSQPAAGKPIDVRIPLTGTFKPEGTAPNAALLYYRMSNGGFRLLPATVEGGTLHAQLPHLSVWDVVYLDDATLNSFAPAKTDPVSRENCQATVQTKAAGKVKIGGKGWSNKADSPVHACLFTDGDKPALNITNNMNYLMPIAATNGVKLNVSSKDADEEMVRLITGKIFPDDRVKGYLGREGNATATLPASSLPATVELVGDPSTFLAESAWFALKFMVGMFVGKPGNEVAADVKFVLDSTDVLSCIKNALNISQGKTPSMGDVAELLTSKCTQIIAEALAIRAANGDWWKQFWGRVFTVGQGLVGGWNNFWTAVDGIRLQLNNTIRITVSRQTPNCPSADEFQRVAAAENKARYGGARSKTTMELCQSGWVYGHTSTFLADQGGIWSDGFQTVMHWNGERWEIRHFAGSDGLIIGEDRVCGEVPSKMRSQICRQQ